jgi:hypothetical protein
MNMNKLLAPVGVALLALLVVVMISAQGARTHIEDQRTA